MTFSLGGQLLVPAPELQITVRVYDYTGVQQGTLTRARRQATQIFNRAGLDVQWELCPISEEAAKTNRECERRADAATIQLSILSKSMAKKMANKSNEFGYAVALPNGFGVIAGIYYDRTIREADSVGITRHVMLGHTMAHEIGHLLLGAGGHSPQGIMTPTWRQREVYLAGMNAFVFTKAQSKKIRATTKARIREAAVQWAKAEEGSGNEDGRGADSDVSLNR